MLPTPQPKSLLLLDGLGALLSTLCLGLILPAWQPLFGMPKDILWILAAPAAIFACYSLLCHWLLRQNWEPYLRIIMLANALYCALSIYLVVRHFSQLTPLGIAYFSLELLILAILITVEYRASF
ncbi:hypothetical protein QWY85_04140 [Neolewinella lacunae]|uniref:Uncharacterized protein n=1 Tax=Neolewinella lacunae TaxID=1517758 RepID=A0A923PRI6_9BACT|nr:hypothetical protein [Neolewinella lacunae]MBC6995422.1 hypothetical protein [Neolewinella lacunae]MDN3633835.1 hypothetical protein [Neolewinella lacunae]